ncbi:rhodanese-like domain-containing protein [Paeniglutamicibacter antarcticus]|uniref:Rhodanese-like domain-containing protein n=1 Tax=Arthrobacter terrae TaxID=2935737 RepID=A0A931G6C8_9MICC|nr:rhodanese-like domain-containing protein [Arthrobacter terrae]MBG0740908.1 rhodanese-like domain-containing protein [Arthrobacter terrae]
MSYAGDLTVAQAWEKLLAGALLVDVRTEAEWNHIGIPDTSATGRVPLFIQWNLTGGTQNLDFLEQLRAQAPNAAEVELIFLCRSGVRSIGAAELAASAGFTSWNVLDGFEGSPDAYGDRILNGWKNRSLPYSRRQLTPTAEGQGPA